MTGIREGRRIAVVLFNLGGPDDAASVKPFLFNLFSDPAIIGLPGFLRTLIARLISSRRETSAQANYAMMDAGGGSRGCAGGHLASRSGPHLHRHALLEPADRAGRCRGS